VANGRGKAFADLRERSLAAHVAASEKRLKEEAVPVIARARAEGATSPTQLAAALNSAAVRPATGKRWRGSMVRALLLRIEP
jgi:hypothetical protein